MTMGAWKLADMEAANLPERAGTAFTDVTIVFVVHYKDYKNYDYDLLGGER